MPLLTSNPALRARSTLALTPVATRTMSALISSSPILTPSTGFPRISLTATPNLNSIPFSSRWDWTIEAISLSSIVGSKCSRSSTTTTSSPSSLNATAPSSPIKPAPITTAFFGFLSSRYAWIFFTSSIVFKVKTPSFSTPFIGGTNALEPVARISLS